MDESIQSLYLDYGDSRTHYYVAGKGEPLVLLHGGGADCRQWLETIQELSAHYRVYAPDMPGFGKSGSLPGEASLKRFSGFMDRFLVGLGLHQVRLMGHSLGGWVALSFALQSPERVERLVLVNSLGLGSEIAWWIRLLCLPLVAVPVSVLAKGACIGLKKVSKLRPRLRTPGWLCSFCAPHPARENLGREVAGWRGQKTDLSHRLAEVEVPTLIVWGSRDEVLPVAQAHRAHGLIPASRLRVLENGGHSAYRQQAQRFHETLIEFLSDGKLRAEGQVRPSPGPGHR